MMDFEDALRELERATGGTITHVNRGESEDSVKGFTLGYDDAHYLRGFAPARDAPERDPWRSASMRGYEAGWDCWHEADEADAAGE